MTDLATAVTESSTLVVPTTTNVVLLTKKNVAVAIVVSVVTIGLGYVLYKIITDYRVKKAAKKAADAFKMGAQTVAA